MTQTGISSSLSEPLLGSPASKYFKTQTDPEDPCCRQHAPQPSDPASRDTFPAQEPLTPPQTAGIRSSDEGAGASASAAAADPLQLTAVESLFLLASKSFAEDSRVEVSLLRASHESIGIHIPPAGLLAMLASVNPLAHKKLILAWGLFLYFLVQHLLLQHDASRHHFLPYDFGGVLLLITLFLLSLRILVSGACVEEWLLLEDQNIRMTRRFCCRTKTTSLDKCEVLDVKVIEKGALVKCAGTLLFGMPKTYLVGRCLSKTELEALAAVLMQYVSHTGQQDSQSPPV